MKMCNKCGVRPGKKYGVLKDGSPAYRAKCRSCERKDMSPAAKERDKERRRLAKQRRRQRMTLEERTAHNRRKRERMSPERRKRRNRVQHMNKHPHLYYRGARCEMCGFVPEYDCQLDVDHIDGDRNNNDPLNLQTLCANCHRAKTHEERDHLNSYDGEQAVDDGQTDLFDGD